jgi:CelD/BcsL family acetyltransferase involved in cellulose biosynthesis
MMNWQVCPLQRSLGNFGPAWDELNASLFGAHPLLSSKFVNLLLQQFGTGTEHLCVLREGQQATGMCILRPDRLGSWSSFLPSQTQISPTLLPELDVAGSLVHALPGHAQQVNLLCVDSAFHRSTRCPPLPPDRSRHAITMSIALHGDFEAYWASRPSSLRKSLRRYERMLASHTAEVRLERHCTPEAVRDATFRYGLLEARGWKGRQGTAVGSDGRQQHFYAELMAACAADEGAEVWELWIDGRLAASRLVLSNDGMLIALKKTYDEDLARFSPGNLLLKQFVELAFREHPGRTIEFYTNATQEQLAWATDRRSIDHYTWFRNAPVELLYRAAHATRQVLRGKGNNEATDDLVVSSCASIDELPAPALDLMTAHAAQSPQLHPDWFRTLVSAVFPSDLGVRFYFLTQGRRCLFVLPVRVQRRWSCCQVEGLANFYSSIYAPAAAEGVTPAQVARLIRTIQAEHPRLQRFNFTPLDVTSHEFSLLRAGLLQPGWAALGYFHFGNWYQHAPASWQAYLQTLDGALRSTLRRKSRKFTQAGGRLELVRDGSSLERAIDAFERVYASSWKHKEPFPQFMPSLIHTCCRHGWLRMGLAWLGGEPVAAQMWMVSAGRAEIYKLAHTPQAEPYSAGTLLTAALMEHVIDRDHVTEIDFLTGDDPFKQHWMHHRRERWGIVAYRPHSIYGMSQLGAGFVSRVLKHLARHRPSRPNGPPSQPSVFPGKGMSA